MTLCTRVLLLLCVGAICAHSVEGFARLPPCATDGKFASVPQLLHSRRAVVDYFRHAILFVPSVTLPSAARAAVGGEANDGSVTKTPVGYRATTVVVGGQSVPVAQWYPLDSPDENDLSGSDSPPYRYQIGIAKLFKAFLGLKLPIPSPQVRSGDAAVRVGAPSKPCKGGIVFAHGMLGSRFDMASSACL